MHYNCFLRYIFIYMGTIYKLWERYGIINGGILNDTHTPKEEMSEMNYIDLTKRIRWTYIKSKKRYDVNDELIEQGKLKLVGYKAEYDKKMKEIYEEKLKEGVS